MNRIVGALSGLALLAAIGAAQAEEERGMVVGVNEGLRTIVLDSGETFTVAEGVPMRGLRPGTEVRVSYEEKDGEKVVTKLRPAK